MPDITMCNGSKTVGDPRGRPTVVICVNKFQCYRYMAKPSQRQSFFAEAPVNPLDQTCREWIPLDRKMF